MSHSLPSGFSTLWIAFVRTLSASSPFLPLPPFFHRRHRSEPPLSDSGVASPPAKNAKCTANTERVRKHFTRVVIQRFPQRLSLSLSLSLSSNE